MPLSTDQPLVIFYRLPILGYVAKDDNQAHPLFVGQKYCILVVALCWNCSGDSFSRGRHLSEPESAAVSLTYFRGWMHPQETTAVSILLWPSEGQVVFFHFFV
jgi:hypothetical protein